MGRGGAWRQVALGKNEAGRIRKLQDGTVEAETVGGETTTHASLPEARSHLRAAAAPAPPAEPEPAPAAAPPEPAAAAPDDGGAPGEGQAVEPEQRPTSAPQAPPPTTPEPAADVEPQKKKGGLAPDVSLGQMIEKAETVGGAETALRTIQDAPVTPPAAAPPDEPVAGQPVAATEEAAQPAAEVTGKEEPSGAYSDAAFRTGLKAAKRTPVEAEGDVPQVETPLALHPEADENRKREVWKDIRTAREQEGVRHEDVTVDLEDLVTHQPTVVQKDLERIADAGLDLDRPLGKVMEWKGRLMVYDGNHRLAIAALGGAQQVKVTRLVPPGEESADATPASDAPPGLKSVAGLDLTRETDGSRTVVIPASLMDTATPSTQGLQARRDQGGWGLPCDGDAPAGRDAVVHAPARRGGATRSLGHGARRRSPPQGAGFSIRRSNGHVDRCTRGVERPQRERLPTLA